jgi:hypothetical protein
MNSYDPRLSFFIAIIENLARHNIINFKLNLNIYEQFIKVFHITKAFKTSPVTEIRPHFQLLTIHLASFTDVTSPMNTPAQLLCAAAQHTPHPMFYKQTY